MKEPEVLCSFCETDVSEINSVRSLDKKFIICENCIRRFKEKIKAKEHNDGKS